jgi:hypothetical protein
MQAAKHIIQTSAWTPCFVSWTFITNWRIDEACEAFWVRCHLSHAHFENLQYKVIWSIDSTAGQRSQPASWHHFFLVMLSFVFRRPWNANQRKNLCLFGTVLILHLTIS